MPVLCPTAHVRSYNLLIWVEVGIRVSVSVRVRVRVSVRVRDGYGVRGTSTRAR